MAVDGTDFTSLHTWQNHELEADRHEIFADDMETGFRQKMMDIGYPASQRVFDRDHSQIRIAIFDGVE